jgi:hypothetical protein
MRSKDAEMAVQQSCRRSKTCADPDGGRHAGVARRRWILGGAVALLAMCAPIGAGAAGDVSDADLQAGARAMGFLDSLPHDGVVVIGVVYSGVAPDGKAQAQQTAERLRAIAGPNNARFQPTLIPVETLRQTQDRLDVLYLMPGVSAFAGTIVETARQRHLLTISDDPVCLDTGCCILMVRAERRVEIVLDIALADAVGVHFPSVFMMLVTRK